jgi:GH35 family endo-1,4-beta-xylanase
MKPDGPLFQTGARACLAGLLCMAFSPPASGFFDGVDAASRPVMARAKADIERNRKGDFVVRLTDRGGAPVKGAVVIELKEHDFAFGANLFGLQKLADGDPARRAAESAIDELFDTVIVSDFWFDNQRTKDGPSDWSIPDGMLDWAGRHGKRARYTALIYGFPKWLAGRSRDEYWRLLEERIRRVAERYGGRLAEFDVINEVVSNKYWKDKADFFEKQCPNFPQLWEPANAARVLGLARQYLPGAKLVVLETGISTMGSARFREILEYDQKLIEASAPFDFVGYQGHYFAGGGMPFEHGHPEAGPGAFTMAKISEGLDLMAALGKPVVITEFQPPSRSNARNDRATQPRLSDDEIAAWQNNYYTLVFSKPYIQGLSRWFVVDELGGRAMDAGLVTRTGKLKPSYFALKKLLTRDWSTRWQGTLQNGEARFRGFYGTYQVSMPGRPPVRFSIAPGRTQATVTIE